MCAGQKEQVKEYFFVQVKWFQGNQLHRTDEGKEFLTHVLRKVPEILGKLSV
ncbi:hypothetical protein KaCgl_18330 [Corynebacterium glutamicum]|nr:hypothetical protein KaCgl_18330 [Corynebacterium glutamicum]